MLPEENKAVVRRFFAALDDQAVDTVGDMLASDYRLHFDGNPCDGSWRRDWFLQRLPRRVPRH